MAEDVTTAHGPAPLHSRRVVIGAGAAGLAGVLVACGDEGDTSAGSGSPTGEPSPGGAGEPAESQPGDADDGAESTDENADDEGGGAEGLVAAADVPIGGGVILADQGIVVTQPTEGEFRAFSSTCTHQGCTVADVSDGLIRCPCHGSRYFIEDGTVENGPATQGLPEVEISEQDGQIVQG